MGIHICLIDVDLLRGEPLWNYSRQFPRPLVSFPPELQSIQNRLQHLAVLGFGVIVAVFGALLRGVSSAMRTQRR
jgi:hypothetical protein